MQPPGPSAWLVRLAVLAALALFVEEARGDPLFEPMSDGAIARSVDRPPSPDTDPTVVRSRMIEVNTEILRSTTRNIDGADLGPAPPLELTLFEGLTVKLDLRAVSVGGYVSSKERDARGDTIASWVGTVQGDEESSASFLVEADTMTGNIHYKGRVYQVRSLGGGVHTVTEVDPAKFPDEAPPERVPGEERDTPPAIEPSLAPDADAFRDTSGPVIDLLVLYTATAEAAASGDIVDEIKLAVLETNLSYEKSGIAQRVNLVGTRKANYAETGDIQRDRDRLRDPDDSHLDDVHTLRDSQKADLVVMLVEDGGGYCGIAYIMESVAPSFASHGFSIVARGCATGYFSFGHELGHLMGARHDRRVDPTDDRPFRYSHGFVNVGARKRSIMGYNHACSDASASCTRIQNWSNPDTAIDGAPFGVPSSQPDAADNRLTLNRTAATVAAFRSSSLPPREVDSIKLAPSPVKMGRGDQETLRALVMDEGGWAIAGQTVRFTTSDSTIAVVSPAQATTDAKGFAEVAVTGGERGKARIEASAGSKSASTRVRVPSSSIAGVALLAALATAAARARGRLA